MDEDIYIQAVDRARELLIRITARYLDNVYSMGEEYSNRYIGMITRLNWLHNRFATKAGRAVLTGITASLAMQTYGPWIDEGS